MYELYYFENEPDIFKRYVIHRASCSYLPNIDEMTKLNYDNSALHVLNKVQNEDIEKVFCLCALCCKSFEFD